jgi:hypothetical protein
MLTSRNFPHFEDVPTLPNESRMVREASLESISLVHSLFPEEVSPIITTVLPFRPKGYFTYIPIGFRRRTTLPTLWYIFPSSMYSTDNLSTN